MKITKEHVGKRVKGSDWETDDYVRVLAVGETNFFGERVDLGESLYPRTCEPYTWEILPDPKPQGAPAFYKGAGWKRWEVSHTLFTSKEEAEEAGYTDGIGVWPARIDPKTGMYILPED